MELIRIDRDQLKIMLSLCDMHHFGLDGEHMDWGDSHTRRSLRQVFNEAGEQVDFSTEGERLLVRVYTSRDGGCEIFVSRLDKDTGGIPLNTSGISTEQASLIEDNPQKTSSLSFYENLPLWLALPSLDDLLRLCRRLTARQERWGTVAYINAPGHLTGWFLQLTLPGMNENEKPAAIQACPSFTDGELCCLWEYGYWEDGSLIEYLIGEYGEFVWTGELSRMGALA